MEENLMKATQYKALALKDESFKILGSLYITTKL